MTDEKTYPIHFDHNLNIHIDSHSLSPEIKKELENMLNERENRFEHETLPEINHMIKSRSYGFEVKLTTNEGKIEEIVQNHIDKEIERAEAWERGLVEDDKRLAEQIEKEFEAWEKGELQVDTELTW